MKNLQGGEQAEPTGLGKVVSIFTGSSTFTEWPRTKKGSYASEIIH
ncbi:hypothetical protein [Desulforamulus reducens]|nr:hypothetical protein [Desulforamulus reducens]